MPPLSKTLEPADYAWIEKQYVERAWHALDGLHRRLDHRHREWEWSLALKAIRTVRGRTVLDIGGGASVFSPAACMMGCDVTQVDLDNNADCIRQHSERCATHASDYEGGQSRFTPMRFIHGDFAAVANDRVYDAVCAISVIEHVADDAGFLCKMCDRLASGGVLVLTTDFHESGKPRCDLHLRTYNRASLTRLQEIAASFGLNPLGGAPAWLNTGTSVNGYNFASLIMQRA